MKNRTKKFTAALIMLLIAAGVICLGFFAGRIFVHEDDPMELTDADIGSMKTFRMGDLLDGDDNNYLIDIDSGEEEALLLRLIVPDSKVNDIEYACKNKELFTGIIGHCTPEMTAENVEYVADYLKYIDEITENYEVSDEEIANIPNFLSPYYIQMTEIGSGSKLVKIVRTLCYLIGGLMTLAALCMLIAAISGKTFGKISLIVGLILGIPILAAGIILSNKIMSFLSIKQIGSGLYSMDYAGSVKIDKLLETDIHSVAEMVDFIRREEFYNLPFSIDEEGIGCAAFAAKTPEGNVIMGRNFDYDSTDTLVIHTKPKDGYEAYALADLKVFGVGRDDGLISPDSELGKAIMLAAPYGVVDGVNEAGLGTAILELEIGETHINTDKHDLCMYNAVRVLLDKCATVDEALTLLAEHDIHTSVGVSYHLFIEDITGRSVVVEWLDDEMCVNELEAATNSVLTKGKYYNRGADRRLTVIKKELSDNNGILTKEQAKELLSAVSQKNLTEWSCVYDLNDFSVDVYMDMDYNYAYHFGGR